MREILFALSMLLLCSDSDHNIMPHYQIFDIKPAPGFSRVADEILVKCPQFNTEAYAPNCRWGLISQCGVNATICNVTSIQLYVWLGRFHGIDDVSETLHVASSISMYWALPCSNYQVPNDDFTINADANLFWKPHIYHANSQSDYSMATFANRFFIEGLDANDTVNAATFFWQLSGVLSSTSDMDFSLFPFDEQTMKIEFLVRDNACAVAFSAAESEGLADTFISEEAGWSYVNSSASYHFMLISGGNRSVATFTLTFRRHPEFYLYNLMIPCCVMTSLQLAGITMPGNLPDRSVFSLTILLALTLMQGQVLDKVPPKRQRMFLVNFTDLCVMFSWLCTVYKLVTCAVVESPDWRDYYNEKVFVCGNAAIRRSRLIDFMTFFIASLFFISIVLYAFSVAAVANYIRI